MEYFRERFIEELDGDGPVTVRDFVWPSSEVFKTMSRNDYDAYFTDWVADRKAQAKDRARTFLETTGCLDRFNRLHGQLQHQSVIPFVGAGMSKATGFLLWGSFLKGLTVDFPGLRDQIAALVTEFRYEEAAQCLLERMGEKVFAEEIENAFGSRRKALKGPVQLLPSLFTRGCITTNFDYVLDRVYSASERKFSDTFTGDRLREVRRRLANDPHCLVRLHGEAESGHGRVLTEAEYSNCYGPKGTYEELFRSLISDCSLLFLGCSLSVDRTFNLLRDIKRSAKVDTPRHFAFLPLYSENEREKRRFELGEADIHPIWYPPQDHDQAIEDLLIALMEGGLHD